jgi:hypothetical protein
MPDAPPPAADLDLRLVRYFTVVVKKPAASRTEKQ